MANNENSTSDALPRTQNKPGIGRRGLVKGLASTPLILSIASRPVWAEPCTPSGERSLNPSATQNDPSTIGGCVTKLFSTDTLRVDPFSAFWSVTGIFSKSYFLEDKTFGLTTSTLVDLAGVNVAIIFPEIGATEPTILEALNSSNELTSIKTALLLNAYIWEKLVAILQAGNIATEPSYSAIVEAGFYYKTNPTLVANSINTEATAWSGYVLL